MNKKILIIALVSVFLIMSVGVISAADDSNSIPVKIVWNSVENQPDHIVVNLIKDGQVVDSEDLSASNSWKTTFKVDDDVGNYEIKEIISDDFSYKISGNAKGGFVIHNALVKEDVLGAVNNESATDNNADEDTLSDANDTAVGSDDSQSGNASASDGNQQGEDNNLSSDDTQQDGAGNNSASDSNSTGNSTDDSNSTDNSTDDDLNVTDGSPDDSKKEPTKVDSNKKDVTTTKTKTTTTTKIIKQENKKPVNTTTNHKNTGFPIVVLVIAVFIAAFIPLSRRK